MENEFENLEKQENLETDAENKNQIQHKQEVYELQAQVKEVVQVEPKNKKLEHEKSETGGEDKGPKNNFLTNNPTIGTTLKIVGWGALAIGLYFILSNFPIFSSGVIDPKTGLLLIFFTGILTSLHCIGMCSGFVVSYASNTSKNEITPHLCYNGGRLLSYVFLGALLGLVGSVFAFNDQIRSYLAILAGMFMVVFGLSMFFPQLRRFVTLPGLNLHQQNGKKSPIVIGLMNGLMPCGPLQAMLIYAAGTGSIIEGASVMLAFGLGTVPLMLVLGSITSIATSSRVLIHKIVKFSGVLVLVLGIIMLSRGFALSGIALPGLSPSSATASAVLSNGSNQQYQEITMYIDKYGWDPNVLTVKKGIPVRWTIIVKELTYCNKGIKVPALGINKVFDKAGDTATFEFTPTETGTIQFTCWMGMIPGRIEVVENPDSGGGSGDQQAQQAQLTPGSAVLNIRGMCCQGCANKIQNTVSQMNGVKLIKVDFKLSQGTVEYDPAKVSVEQIISKINSIGYQAKLA